MLCWTAISFLNTECQWFASSSFQKYLTASVRRALRRPINECITSNYFSTEAFFYQNLPQTFFGATVLEKTFYMPALLSSPPVKKIWYLPAENLCRCITSKSQAYSKVFLVENRCLRRRGDYEDTQRRCPSRNLNCHKNRNEPEKIKKFVATEEK